MGIPNFRKILQCGRRKAPKEVKVKDPLLCPISGRSSENGCCPVSGNTTTSLATAAMGVKNPQMTSGDLRSAELKAKGNEHFKNKEFQLALDAYGQAVMLSQKDVGLWVNRSITNRQLGNWQEAADDAEIAATIDVGNPKAFYSWAVSLQNLKSFAKAIEICKLGLKTQPDNKPLKQLLAELSSSVQANIDELEEDGAVAVGEVKCPSSGALQQSDVQAIKEKAAAYKWKGSIPCAAERAQYKQMLVGMFLSKYKDLSAQRHAAESYTQGSILETQYEPDQKNGLVIQGGHRPMKRPKDVNTPDSFRKPVGVITVAELGYYGCKNPDGRYFIAVYGNIFDISDRPDKYGPDGPYKELAGTDITWGLFTGLDTLDYTNRFYDLFKAKDQGMDKMSGLCSWWAWYTNEYGEPVGKVKEYEDEANLPAPPLEEVEEGCCIM